MSSSSHFPLGSVFNAAGTFHNVMADCPNCGAGKAAFTELGEIDIRALGHKFRSDGWPTNAIALKVGLCPVCRGMSIGVAGIVGGLRDKPMRGLFLWPEETWPDRAPAALREESAEIKQAYDEARVVLSRSPQAAAALARRCVQHVIRSRLGITRKKLFDEIAEAITRDELSKPTREQLDHVRTIGNWAAHPCLDQSDTLIEVAPEEAAYTLEVLEMLFEDLYVKPAQASQMKQRIAAKKAGNQGNNPT